MKKLGAIAKAVGARQNTSKASIPIARIANHSGTSLTRTPGNKLQLWTDAGESVAPWRIVLPNGEIWACSSNALSTVGIVEMIGTTAHPYWKSILETRELWDPSIPRDVLALALMLMTRPLDQESAMTKAQAEAMWANSTELENRLPKARLDDCATSPLMV